ncbi:MAG: MFS transporter [Firmicutes bacterium]|nr:MFS transporter [Bacillota bacterium]
MINVKSKRVNILFLLSAILLIVIVLGFTGGINIASFHKNYSNSLISSYAVSGKETVRKIEYAVKYGKPLDVFYGMEDLLAEKFNESSDLGEVQVVLPNGKIIYDHSGSVEDKQISSEIRKKISQEMRNQLSLPNGETGYASVLHQGEYHLFIPIMDTQNNRAGWIGSVDLVFDKEVINKQTNKYMTQLGYYLVVLALIALFLLTIFISKFSIVKNNKEINTKLLMGGFIIILGTVQAIYGYINYNMFKEAYIDIAKENVAITSKMIEKDINYVVSEGVPYGKLNLDDYLKEVITEVPEVETISLTNKDGKVFTSAGDDIGENEISESNLSYSTSLIQDAQGVKSKLTVNLSNSYLDSKLKVIVYDVLTVMVMSLIIMVESTYFSLIFLRRQLDHEKEEVNNKSTTSEAEMIRPLTFTLFFGFFMSGSFIPLLMQELYRPILGLSENVILGLPISMEMFMGAIAAVLAGYVIDRRGWRMVFFVGLAVAALGTLLSGLASDAIAFIIARGITGAGYGFALISIRSYVNSFPSEEEQTKGFTAMFSGLYAGVIAGVVVGAMLADRIGFSQVFYVILAFIILAAIFNLVFIKGAVSKENKQGELSALPKISVLEFLFDGKVLVFFLTIVIPLTISSMFLDYYFPIFASDMGASVSNVGRAFMFNGLCIVYLGPLLSKYAGKYFKSETAVIVSGLIIVASFLLFALYGSMLTAFLVVIMLGVSESFGLMAQNNYFIKLQATGAFGVGKSLGYYDNVRKLGQMLGPVLFGSVMVLGIKGIGMIGVISLVALLIFWFVNRTNNEANRQQQRGVGV